MGCQTLDHDNELATPLERGLQYDVPLRVR